MHINIYIYTYIQKRFFSFCLKNFSFGDNPKHFFCLNQLSFLLQTETGRNFQTVPNRPK